MPEYHRNYVPGGTYFFTVVSHERRPILTSEQGRACMRQAFKKVREKFPFEVFAIVLLPHHLHTIWRLPEKDDQYAVRWARIKEEFTRNFLNAGGGEAEHSRSRQRHRELAVWQRRFWEHTCRDDDDLKRFLDYLHWNPVKHGLVSRVQD
jgi:putative transposase